MGANESKPASAHIWKASGPSGVSQDLVDSLQSSHETDASRQRTMELQVQARVAEELKKLQQKESEALSLAHDKLSSAAEERDKDGKDESASRYSVGKEVEELRRRLDERKKLRDVPKSVEKARSEVVRCLLENDRRPLDCWQEVENFKAEVKKLEKGWVDKVTS